MIKNFRHVLIALVLSAPLAAPGDVLVLTDGTRLEGRVEPGSSRDRVAIVRATGRIELPNARIKEVVEESDAQDYTHLGFQHLSLKNFDQAVRQFTVALEADPEFEPALAGMGEAEVAMAAIHGELERQRLEQLGQSLEAVPELITNEAFEKAQETLDRVMDAGPTDEQSLMARKLMRDLYLAWGFSRFDRLDMRGAEEKYSRVLEMDPDNSEARNRLLRIWQRDPSKKDEILKAYQDKLREEPGNLEFNKIVGEALYDKEEYETSIPYLQRVYTNTRFAGLGLDRKLQNAYRESIRRKEVAQDWPGAIASYEEMLTQFPNQDQTQLIVLRYRADRKQLAEDDYSGWAILVKRLYESGLNTFAVREAELIQRYDPTNEIAVAVIRNEALAQINAIDEEMLAGQYAVARDMAERFIREEGRFPDLLDRARELYNRADIEARRAERAVRESARDIAQRGIEYYNEAVQFANRLASDDTRTNQRVVNYKGEATNRTRRAISHFETALKMDPSLGGIDGMDLNSRMRDAQALLRSLTEPAPFIRPPRNRQ